MDICYLVLRKKCNVSALTVTILTLLCFSYYLARYDNVCISSATNSGLESDPYKIGHPKGVVSVLDHGCYLQASDFTQHQHSPDLLAKRNCTQKIPAALIVGAALSGSLTLKSALSFHPDVVVPEFVVPFKDNDQYLDRMPYSLPDQITVGECQEFLYMDNLSTKTVDIFHPDLKVIILIRDPVARAMSEYLALRSSRSSQFYRGSLSNYPDAQLEAAERRFHKRDQGRSRRNARQEESKRHQEKTSSTSIKARIANHRRPYLKASPSSMHYNLEDTFEKTVLRSPSKIDEVHFLLQRSIDASGIEQWASVIPRINYLVLDAEKFARSPAATMDIVEKFLGLRPFFQQDFFEFDLLNGVFCFNSPVRSCVEPVPIQNPPPHISADVVALLREFFVPPVKFRYKFVHEYFPHFGENPMIFTPFR